MQSSITQMQKWFAKARDCRLRKCPGRIEIWSSQWIRTNKICSHWQFMPHKFGLTYGPWETWCFVRMSSVNFLPPLHFGGTRQTSRMLFLHFEQHPISHFDRTWKKPTIHWPHSRTIYHWEVHHLCYYYLQNYVICGWSLCRDDVWAFDESPVVQNDIAPVFKLSHHWADRDPKRPALGAVQFTLKGFEGYHVGRHSFIVGLCESNDGCAQGFVSLLLQWHSLRNLEKVMPCEFKMTSLASAKNHSGCIYGQELSFNSLYPLKFA